MKTFTVCNSSTGAVIRIVSLLLDSDAELQAKSGELVRPFKTEDLAERLAQDAAIQAQLTALRETLDPLSVIVEALRQKGIDLKPQDLEAAKSNLQAQAVAEVQAEAAVSVEK